MTKKETEVFKYIHPVSGDVFTYEDGKHAYKLNDIDLPGTTTPLELMNELSWDSSGKMTSKSFIIQQWALGRMEEEILEKAKEIVGHQDDMTEEERCDCPIIKFNELKPIVAEAKKAPNKKFKSAGVSGTEIHALVEAIIKNAIANGGTVEHLTTDVKQVQNFIDWANKNKVKFLYSEEPIYSKEWMNCGTVDFICEIDGKILVGDIKTNGDKRRYAWDSSKNKYDYSKPVSDIHTNALFQTGAYAKMATEEGARKLVEKVDGVVIVNIKKSGDFDEKLDVRYDYNISSLIEAYNHVIKLYQIYRSK